MTIKEVKLTYIIDDDSIFVFVLKKLLEKHNNFGEVREFKTSSDALEILFENDTDLPSVILLDLNMPVIDGWQLLDKLQQSDVHKNINVFVISSSIDTTDIQKSKQYSIVKDFVSKPINLEKLDDILIKVS